MADMLGRGAPTTGTTTGTVAAGDDSRIVNALQSTSNLTDLSDPATARAALGHVDRRQSAARNVAMVVGISGNNLLCPAGGDTGAFTGTANGLKQVNGRQWYGLKAANTTNGGACGGWAPGSTNTLYWYAASGYTWEIVYALYIPSASTLANLRIWVGVTTASTNHPNTADGANVHMGARFDGVGGDTKWTASCRSAAGAGNQTTAVTDTTVAKETGYSIRCRWTGTAFEVSVATIGADGAIGTYGTAASISADLPASSTALQWAIACYQDGTPGAAQEMYIGDTDSVIGAI